MLAFLIFRNSFKNDLYCIIVLPSFLQDVRQLRSGMEGGHGYEATICVVSLHIESTDSMICISICHVYLSIHNLPVDLLLDGLYCRECDVKQHWQTDGGYVDGVCTVCYSYTLLDVRFPSSLLPPPLLSLFPISPPLPIPPPIITLPSPPLLPLLPTILAPLPLPNSSPLLSSALPYPSPPPSFHPSSFTHNRTSFSFSQCL